MEFKTKMQTIQTVSALLDATDERPIDADVVLPDYCPDVAAILTCELMPSVTACGQNGDKLTADGTALLRVLYLDEERKTVYTYEMSQAFAASFSCDGRVGEMAADVTAEADYVHCRAVSPRRLDIHGAVRVHAAAVSTGEQTALAGVEEDGVFLKTAPVTSGVPAGWAQKPFSVNEPLGNADGAERVVRSCAVPTVTETKVLAGKVIVKGDLVITALLLCDGDSGKTAERRFSLPFSQMVDLAGTDENTTVDARVRVTAHHLRLEEENGETVLVSTTKLLLSAQAWKEETATVVTDAYAASMPVSLETGAVTGRRLLAVSSEPLTVSETFSADNVASVRAVWCEATPLSYENGDGVRLLRGRLAVHLLTESADGQIQYLDHAAEFSETLAAVGSGEETAFAVTSCEALSETEGQLTVKATLCACRRQYAETSAVAVTAITGDESAAYPASAAAVKIVYADAGETLWDVAKAAHTSVDALKIENELEADVLDKRTMLLVPLA